MLVGDITKRDLTALSEDTGLLEAVSIMELHGTSGLPVVSDAGRVAGFISEKDILRAIIPGYLGYMDENFLMPAVVKIRAKVKRVGYDSVREYMTKNCLVFDESETVMNALVAFFRKDVKCAPVVSGGMFVGMVDREAILRGFFRENPEEVEPDALVHTAK
ncbi:MAG: CBS domain-containing protein [Synergistaceae bacterium]|jgi:CBS domain-containing protein|nr:CBS domain-containing protein [Synergistaceae bacterium]